MTTTAIREKLYDYIRDADDKKVEALYVILGGEVEDVYNWEKDDDFIAELDDRVMRVKTGVDKGVTLEEFQTSIDVRYKRHS